MNKNLKKMLAGTMALTMVAGMAGCSKAENTSSQSTKEETKTTETTKTEEKPAETEQVEEEEPVRDLGGIEITIGNWWANPDAENLPAANQQEEDLRAYRKMIQEKYNFTIKEVNLGGWGEYQEIFMTSVMAGDPAADIFIMDPGFVAQPLAKGLFYPLNELPELDFSEKKWNKQVEDIMTFGENIYGMVAAEKLEPRNGVFFNKRLIQEAGLEDPYDLQASGRWTWDTFKEYAKALTVDKDNDGVMDTYGLASFSVDYFTSFAFSNNAAYIGKDENGKFYNAMTDPNFLEAMQFGRSIIQEGYEMPQPEGSEWDWFVTAFKDGKVAMQVAQQHHVSTWADMEDDWGFVLFPAGPKGDMVTVFSENVVVMPSGLKNANDIAFAYNLYTEPLEEYSGADDWKDPYYPKFRDSRAVDETLAMMYEGHSAYGLHPLVYGISTGDICYTVGVGEQTPAELIQSVSQKWQVLIDDANGGIK